MKLLTDKNQIKKLIDNILDIQKNFGLQISYNRNNTVNFTYLPALLWF